MRKLAVWTAVLGLTALPALSAALPGTVAAAATTTTTTSTTTATAQPAQPDWLRLSLTSLRPSVVTSADTVVTMTARITNISDRPITDLTSRIQLGDALTSGADIHSALAPTAVYQHSDTDFTPVTGTLAPGHSVAFTVSEPVRGPRSLGIDEPGVYPLMINVQGVPAYGNTARLVVGTMLLPVVSAPGAQAPAAGAPSALTVLWPLVDQQPRVVGSDGDQPVLSDDTLATSLSPGGRLYGLLAAVRENDDPALLSSLCFAVDPDLLDTVRAMSTGYRVQVAPGRTAPGTGKTAAGRWLSALKQLTQGQCVLALPYADADLIALAHADGTTLLQLALSQSSSVATELGAAPLTDVVWPADGTLDTTTMTDLAGLGVHTALVNQTSVTPAAGSTPVSLAGFTGADAPRVVPADSVITGAMAPRTDEPNVDNGGVATQDGLAATLYQTVFGGAHGGAVLVAPPRRWTPSQAQAVAFLGAARAALAGHYATATPLADAVHATPSTAPAALNYPVAEHGAEVSHRVAAAAVQMDGQERDVENSMTKDHTTPTPILPAQLITPLRLSVLRAVSTAWRNGDRPGATAALTAADDQFTALTGQVQVLQPNLPLLLGSKTSRVPVTVSNKLPVDMSIQVDLTGDPGLPSGSREDDVVPAGSSVTVFIPTSVTRSGRLSAYATVRTIGGTQLGQQARLELVSSAYGTIVVIVTAIAFGLLVLLSGRRIYRRAKASRAAAATVQPDPEAVGALVGADRRTSEQQEPDEH